MKDDPVVALLTVKHGPPIEELFDSAELENTAEVCMVTVNHKNLIYSLRSEWSTENI